MKSTLVMDDTGGSVIVIEASNGTTFYVDLSGVIGLEIGNGGAVVAHLPGGKIQILDLIRADADRIAERWLILRGS